MASLIRRSRRDPFPHPLGDHNHAASTTFQKRRRDEAVIDPFNSPKRPRVPIHLSSPTRNIQPIKAEIVSRIEKQHHQQHQTQQHNQQQHLHHHRQPQSQPQLLVQQQPTPPQKPASAPRSSKDALPKTQPRPRNAVQRELGSLQSGRPIPKAAEGRKLRSQEATRFKSDLAAYFPDYDVVIGNDAKPEHLLDVNTPVIVVDSSLLRSTVARQPSGTHDHDSADARPQHEYPIRSYADYLFTDLWESQEISFAFLQSRNSKTEDFQDPLPDSYFESAHKKAERAEKSIRNSERGRAQHEKEQIIRLLDGLQGPDWLRTMGVSGITEGRKKEFEGPRRYFIQGCEAILEKFRQWGVEEKRRKLEKDRAVAVAARLENCHDHESETHDAGGSEVASVAVELVTDTDAEPPDSDVDASIAKQLRDETKARSRVVMRRPPAKRSRRQQDLPPPQPPAPPPDPVPLKPFISFFDKKYLRDAALNKSRRKGRTVLAWGHTVPDMVEVDFEIPSEFLDEKTLRSNARRKRRNKRDNKR